jgi:tetratricopeptide (TPR) repeat protein
MDRREEELKVVSLSETLLGRPLPEYRIWALIKLDRFDDAEKAIDEVLRISAALSDASDRDWIALGAMNGRTALEFERRRRQACFSAAMAAVERFATSAVLWYNAGEAALGDLRLDKAEECFVKSTECGRPDFHGTSFRPLAMLFLAQGRLPEAMEALKRAQSDRMRREPHSLQQDQSCIDTAVASFLLALGRASDAERIARRVAEMPDRAGSTSADEKLFDITGSLLFFAALRSRIFADETTRAAAGASRLMPDPSLEALRIEVWKARKRIQLLLADEAVLVEVLRPYLTGITNVEPWLVGTIVQALPPAVALAAVAKARRAEDHPKAKPYLDALEAEARLLLGDAEPALDLAESALLDLPRDGEVLLRARIAAVGGEAASKLGQRGRAYALWNQALVDFPAVFALLGLPIPARIETEAGGLAARLAEVWKRSPLFEEDASGFPIRISVEGHRVSLEMFRLGDARHVEVSEESTANAEESVRRIAESFAAAVLSPRLDLTQSDINSLDGSPAAARARAEVNATLSGGR